MTTAPAKAGLDSGVSFTAKRKLHVSCCSASKVGPRSMSGGPLGALWGIVAAGWRGGDGCVRRGRGRRSRPYYRLRLI